jgi:hypothetical protein
MVRCRACSRCRKYIIIHPGNPINQLEIKKFEKKHLGHTIMTVDLNEIKGMYEPFKNNGEEKPSQ